MCIRHGKILRFPFSILHLNYRYPDRTVQYAPVFPFDWDMPNVKCKMENVECV